MACFASTESIYDTGLSPEILLKILNPPEQHSIMTGRLARLTSGLGEIRQMAGLYSTTHKHSILLQHISLNDIIY